jgi:hypothetical protein
MDDNTVGSEVEISAAPMVHWQSNMLLTEGTLAHHFTPHDFVEEEGTYMTIQSNSQPQKYQTCTC